VGSVDTPGYAGGVAVSAAYAYVTDGSGLLAMSLQCETGIEPIGLFTPVSPELGDSIHTAQPTLAWNAAVPSEGDTVSYTVYWSEEPFFVEADSAFASTDTSLTMVPGALHIETTYHWRVRAFNDLGQRWSDPSEGWWFYVEEDVTALALQCEAAAGVEGILIRWQAFDAVGILEYLVYRRPAADGAPGTGGPGNSGWEQISPALPAGNEGKDDDLSGSYLDTSAEAGVVYEYLVEALGPNGPAGRFGPVRASWEGPPALSLQVRPNPLHSPHGAGSIALTMPRRGDAVLRLYNAQGRQVSERRLTGLAAGAHVLLWDPVDGAGRKLPSGSYYLWLETPSELKNVREARTVRWTVVQ